MPDNPTQPKSPPEEVVEYRAVEAAVRWKVADMAMAGWTASEEFEENYAAKAVRPILEAATPHIIAAYEEQPNVLSVEEARLLVKANERPAPDTPEEMGEFVKLMDRLDAWAAEEGG